MKISALRIRIFMKHMDASEELKCISPFIATDYSHKAHSLKGVALHMKLQNIHSTLRV